MSAIAGGVGIGAGVGASTVALAPFNAANTFMGSAFFGYGMILGERYMYQADWPKIQARLEHGEKIENIIQEYTGTFAAVVMKEAKIIFESVTEQFTKYIEQRLSSVIPQPVVIPPDAPTIGDPRRPRPPSTITPPNVTIPTPEAPGLAPPGLPQHLPPQSSPAKVIASQERAKNKINNYTKWNWENRPKATAAIRAFVSKMIDDLRVLYNQLYILVKGFRGGDTTSMRKKESLINQTQVAINSTLKNWNWA